MARYVVEAEGEGVAEALGALDGVASHHAEPANGHVRVNLEASAGAEHLGPQIFSLAREHGWTLWEMHRERDSLEDVFRELTADDGVADAELADGPDDEGDEPSHSGGCPVLSDEEVAS